MGDMEDYYFYKSRGICVNCHNDNAMHGAVRCPECADKLSKFDSRRYAEIKNNGYDEYRRSMSKKNNERRAERRKAGICWMCGKRPVQNGYMKCIDCHTKIRKKKDYRYNNDIPRNERPDYGLCYICGSPKMEKHNTCEKHYKILADCFKVHIQTEKRRQAREEYKRFNNLIFQKKQKGELASE